MKNILIIFILLLSTNHSFAASGDSQFNFDDNYQGEESPKAGSELLVYDPWESVNRQTFALNELLDKNIALPVVRQYRKLVPNPVRSSVGNFVQNLSSPFSTINSLIQGDGQNAMASFSSFLINSTIGVFGLFDVAGNKNIKYNEEDFGQSFAKYGSKTGPYLVIPILGPSNLRDFSGFLIEKAINPLAINGLEIGGEKDLINDEVAISLALASGIRTREGLIDTVDDMRKNSFDTYATMRSAYLQHRAALVKENQKSK